MNVAHKRIYDNPSRADGTRVLVDRLWPRGMSKANARLDLWLRDIAPSTGLRKWFGHDPKKWPMFRKKYRTELKANPEAVRKLKQAARGKKLTLLYAARDEAYNEAVVIREFLGE